MKQRRGRPSGKTATPPQQNKQQVYTTNKAEVLELVVTFTHDAALLAKATVLSSYYRDIALTSIQQQLPTLLVRAVKQAVGDQAHQDSQQAEANVKGAVRWLCAAAGRQAVSQPEVAAALLAPELVRPAATAREPGKRRWAWEPAEQELADAGLQLSDAVVAAAARQQLPSLSSLVMACCDAQETAQGSTNDCSTGGLSKLYAAVFQDDPELLEEELKVESTSANTVIDLLFITINEYNKYAPDAFRLVWEFDAAHTRAVNINPPILASVGPSGARATRSSSTLQPGHPQQLQQPAQLLEQLMLTCLVADHSSDLLCELVGHPAAAGVGVAGVTKLMHVAALLGNRSHSNYAGYNYETTNMLSLLAKVPAAKDVSSATIAGVFRTLVHSRRSASEGSLSGLFDLPAASSLSSREVCDMLLLAMRKGSDTRGYLDALSQLASRCKMESTDVRALLTTMFEEQGSHDFCDHIGCLERMNLGQHLSIDDTLTVLTKICEGKNGSLKFEDYPGEYLKEAINTLGFSHKKFHKKDAASYVTFLQVIVRTWWDGYLEGVAHVVLKANKGPTLDHQQYMQLLRFCVVAGRLPYHFLGFPVSKSVSAGEVLELLQLCFEKQPRQPAVTGDGSCCSSEEGGSSLYLIPVLTKLPHAQDLTADSILQLMQRTLQEEYSCTIDDALCSLAALPLAQQISTADARALVLTAFKQDDMQQLNSLCKCLPACAAAWEGFDEGEVLQQRLQKALAGDRGKEVCSLLQHANMQKHAADVLPKVLLAAFRSWGRKRQGIFWPPPAKEQTGQQAGDDIKLELSQAQLLQLLQLPAAAGLSVPVLHELMQLSLQRMDGALLQELVQLPAAQQLSDDDIALLLRLAAGQTGAAAAAAGTAVKTAAAAGASGSSSGARPATDQQQCPTQRSRSQRAKRQGQQQQEAQPGQRQDCMPAGSEVLAGLVLHCLQQPKGAAGLFPLLLLPWAQQLPAACVKALLQAAAERHARGMFEHLLRLPQAPRADPEVQVYAEILRFSCAAADLTDFAPQEERHYQPEEREEYGCSSSSSSEESESEHESSED